MKFFSNLRTFNLFMAGLHFVQGVLMLLLANDFKLPVTTSYLAGEFMLAPMLETIADLRIGPLVALFLFLSAVAHLLISLPGFYEWYDKNIKKGINYARWYEYAVSSSVMIVIIAMLVGVYDFSLLLMIFSINVVMIFGGLMMEVYNQGKGKPNWLAYWVGSFAGIMPWVVIALYLFNSGEGDAKAPDFVYWIFFSIFIFFNTFAINMILQYKKVGKWKDYIYGERMYIILSLVAKSALAWQVFAGTLRPA